MAEDKIDGREATWRQLLPWTELFRGFQIALDLNKLLLAAGGILTMAFGWWLLAWFFVVVRFNTAPPTWESGGDRSIKSPDKQKAWADFRRERDEWNLMYESAGIGSAGQRFTVDDLANGPEEYESFKDLGDKQGDALEKAIEGKDMNEAQKRLYRTKLGKLKQYAALSTWPWWENRGPNPYLLVTGQAGIPWEAGRFWDWFLRDQMLVMIEPLVKFVRPIIFFFSPRTTGYTSVYFLCVLLWTLATWALFGGAITRIAAVQATRGEKIGLREAVRFTFKRIVSYLIAPLFPLAFVFLVLFFTMLFGLFHMIPVVGDVVVDGLLWWLMLICGLVMAVTLVGLVGWPLMSATISTEGTDSWEAVSRSYSYVYQKPWHYAWYTIVAIAYGAVLVFFVGFMGSLTVYLAKWSVSKTPFVSVANREPTYLFVYSPTSFGWRTLLLEGATVEGRKIVENGEIQQAVYDDYFGDPDQSRDRLHTWNKIGAFLVAIWLGLVFLLLLGFGYSYFWSASTIIYLLMRRHVDAAEMDEVYLEEDDNEGPYGGHFTPPVAPVASESKSASSLTMVEPPTLRTPPPAASSIPESPPAIPPAPSSSSPPTEAEPPSSPTPPKPESTEI